MIVELLTALSLYMVYYYLTYHYGYWKLRGIPHEKPLFIFGNFKEALTGKAHFGMVYTALYRKFVDRPFVGCFKHRTPELLIRNRELVGDILINKFSHFRDNDFQVDPKLDPLWATNPFAVRGNEWKVSRVQWAPIMTQAKLKKIYDRMQTNCQSMIEHFQDCMKANSNASYETKDLASNFLTDNVVYGFFGIRINSFKESDNPFRKLTRMMYLASLRDGPRARLLVLTPWIGKLLSLRFVSQKVHNLCMNICKEIMISREKTNSPSGDIYDHILQSSQQIGKDNFSQLDLARILYGMLLDGAESSSGPLAYALFEIARNPSIQKRLRDELNSITEDHGNISYEQISKANYLDMVVSETLRMYPTIISFTRVCNNPCTLESDYWKVDITPGMKVTIPSYALHMDPILYPDPENFDPERFSPESKNKIPKYSYMPFGDGPRICIGVRLGLLEIKLAIAGLVQNFELQLSRDTKPNPQSINPNTFTMRPIDRLLICFKPLLHTHAKIILN